jgi:hypothetical protein
MVKSPGMDSRAESDGDNRGSIVAPREVRECLESLGRLLAKTEAANKGPGQDGCFNLSRLSDEELRQVAMLLEKAYIRE